MGVRTGRFTNRECRRDPKGDGALRPIRRQVFVGTSHDTPAFSVTAFREWWAGAGRRRYPQTKRLLILADCGGSNRSRTRAWKYELQTRFCDRFGLTLTVCHYPRGHPSGTPSSIASSVRSARTGLANPSRATRPYSTFFAPRRPRPVLSSMPPCSTATTDRHQGIAGADGQGEPTPAQGSADVELHTRSRTL